MSASIELIIEINWFSLVIHDSFTASNLTKLILICKSYSTLIPILILHLHRCMLHVHLLLLLLLGVVLILCAIVDNYTLFEVLIGVPHHIITRWKCTEVLRWIHVAAHWCRE